MIGSGIQPSRQVSGRWVRSAVVAIVLGSSVGCARTPIDLTLEQSPTTTAVATAATAATAAIATQATPEDLADEATGDGERESNATVIRAVDGDTIRVQIGGTKENVRLIGIDTPETHRPGTPIQCFGPEASRFTAALLPPGTPVLIEGDVEARDRYGRLLGYVSRSADGLFVNLALVEFGFAHAYTYPPNVTHTDALVEAAERARDANRGLWGGCSG